MNPPSLYEALLGPRFDQLAVPVACLHRPGAQLRCCGRAQVERGSGWLAQLTGWVMGLPPAADDVPLQLLIEVDDGTETWTRDFGGHRLRSRQWAARGLLCEQMGSLRMHHLMEIEQGALRLRPQKVAVCGLRLPRVLWPQVQTAEFEQGGRYGFDVSASLPGIGRIVRYSGWLASGEAT